MKSLLKRSRSGAATIRILSLTMLPVALVLAGVLVLRQPLSAHAQADDTDGDGLADAWELAYGLNPEDPADAGEDADGDGLSAKAEMQQGTDPHSPDTDRDGFMDGEDNAPLSRVFVEWGSPFFTKGDDYLYPAPDWFVGAFQKGGKWKPLEKEDDKPGWLGGHNGERKMVGRLAVVVNPPVLDADLVVEVDLEDDVGELRAGLVSGDGSFVLDDLNGNLLGGQGGEKKVKFKAPFKDNPQAVAMAIYRKGGKVSVYRTMAYVDDDGDGLDREQEEQLGTSDAEADSDADGLDDFSEVFRHGTEATLKDSDADGMPDAWEVANKLKPMTDDAALDADADGRSNYKEFLLVSDPNAAPAPIGEGEGGLVVGTPLEPEPANAGVE